MSAEPARVEDTSPPARPGRKPFVVRRPKIQMGPDAVARQGRVSRIAWEAFPDREAVLSFLNTHHEQLGGRPIDIAAVDAPGLAAVEATLATIATDRRALPAERKPMAEPSENPDRGTAG